MRRHAMNLVYWTGLILLGFLLALAALEAGMGRGPAGVTVASHEYDGDQDYDQGNNEDRNRNRNRNRGAFSPGPFDRSPVDAFNGNTVCLPGSTCYSDRREEGR